MGNTQYVYNTTQYIVNTITKSPILHSIHKSLSFDEFQLTPTHKPVTHSSTISYNTFNSIDIRLYILLLRSAKYQLN